MYIKIPFAEETYRNQSNYQSIQIFKDDIGNKSLIIDGRIQLNTGDSYRYDECLGIIPYLFTKFASDILIIGGGDGQVANTLLEFANDKIGSITIVDIDPEVIFASKLHLSFPLDKKVNVINEDAWDTINKNQLHFDLVIMDLTDATQPHASRMYTKEALLTIKSNLMNNDAVFVTQALGPVINPKAFSCILSTVADVFQGYNVLGYKTYMPYMNCQQGFVLASPQNIQLQVPILRYINPVILPTLFVFATDELYPQMPVSTLDDLLYGELCKMSYAQIPEEWKEQDDSENTKS